MVIGGLIGIDRLRWFVQTAALVITGSGRIEGIRVVHDISGITDYAIGAVRQWDFMPRSLMAGRARRKTIF